MEIQILEGNALDLLKTIGDNSIDAVITDPPYAEIDRDYGRLSEAVWMDLMKATVKECKRIVKPTGSAMFVLQPNFQHIGKMRLWVWDFISWAGREWNLIQNVYWWNIATLPTAGCQDKYGLMRNSIKYCVWLGEPNCYRDQSAVLWTPSARAKAEELEKRFDKRVSPSGHRKNYSTIYNSMNTRGGVTPFNVLPFTNSDSVNGGGAFGHGASTPAPLVDWWIKYISKPGDTILDPFFGSGTTGISAYRMGRNYIGIEKEHKYIEIATSRIAQLQSDYTLNIAA